MRQAWKTGPVVVLLAALGANAAHGAALSLETVPNPARLGVGETVAVSLVTSPDFEDFTGVEMNVTYDADVLSYKGASFHSSISMLTEARSEPADASGRITIEAITGTAFMGDGGSGAATLATLSFGADGSGTSEVEISGINGGTLVVGPPDVDATLSTDVEVVPLPAPFLLLGSALAGLGYLRHRARTA